MSNFAAKKIQENDLTFCTRSPFILKNENPSHQFQLFHNNFQKPKVKITAFSGFSFLGITLHQLCFPSHKICVPLLNSKYVSPTILPHDEGGGGGGFRFFCQLQQEKNLSYIKVLQYIFVISLVYLQCCTDL